MALVGRPSPMPTIGALLIADSHPMRQEAAQRALGVSLRPLDVTIADAVAWRSGRFR